MLNEIRDDLVHLVQWKELDGTIFHVLVPLSWEFLLHLSKSIFEESIKLVFIEFSHNSKARSLEEEIKVLIVFCSLWPTFFFPGLAWYFIFNLLLVIRIKHLPVRVILIFIRDDTIGFIIQLVSQFQRQISLTHLLMVILIIVVFDEVFTLLFAIWLELWVLLVILFLSVLQWLFAFVFFRNQDVFGDSGGIEGVFA